ncbi:tyrosine-type recombinase/integrase [Peribacillus kribbensis]|uniref:tyrosine-type recombinase/integrase n=1 Tax=Peribacillus kribbensis TaxID=356658 RepID=UPI00316AD4D0
MSWLKNPYGDNKVTSLVAQSQPRKPRTINTILNTVTNFYDYLMRHEEFNLSLSKNLKTQISGSKRGFRDFLYHINKSKTYTANVFKVKVPKSRPKTIKKDDVVKIIDACSNVRDRFLIQLLWESGIRIGEALSLWLEDFEIDSKRIVINNRGELANGASIKTIGSERKVDVSDDLMNLYFEYIAEIHDDEVDTNHVFIKLSGNEKNQPLDYDSVIALFKRLEVKTGVQITPHMLRHTSLNELRKAGWKNEHLMKRAGHKNIQTTMNFYMHVDDEELKEEWEKTEANLRLNKNKECKDD